MSTIVSAYGLAPRPFFIATAIYLNGQFRMVGRSPSGYVGYVFMWSIFDIHYQRWREKVRDVFRNTRYMKCEGPKKNVDVAAFVTRYGRELMSRSNKLVVYSKWHLTHLM